MMTTINMGCKSIINFLWKARKIKNEIMGRIMFMRNQLSILWVTEGKCGYDVNNFFDVLNKKMAKDTFGAFAPSNLSFEEVKETLEDFRETFCKKKAA